MGFDTGLIGVAAGIFALGGFLFSRECPLRILSSIAAVLFIIYASILGSPTLIVLNSIILFIHVYKLTRMWWARGAKSDT